MIFVNVIDHNGCTVPVATTAIETCHMASTGDCCVLGLTSGKEVRLSSEYGPDPLLVTQRISTAVRQLQQRNERLGKLSDLGGR